jgi:hypothetical protein
MASIINAVSGSGITSTADGSGIIKIQSNSVTTNALAWVNFNGTGTVAIRSSYNVSSITDNGTGDYTVNFATALSDANYCLAGASNLNSGIVSVVCENLINVVRTTSAFRISSLNTAGGSYYDSPAINVIIHGN